MSVTQNPPDDSYVGKVLSKIHARLRDKAELVKLHLKHYHMKSKSFQKRTSALKCPKDIYDLYEEVVKECPACQKHVPAPERSRITGMRATEFGAPCGS